MGSERTRVRRSRTSIKLKRRRDQELRVHWSQSFLCNHQVLIDCSQSDRWLRQANIIDGWNTTTIHTAIAFRKTSKGKIFLDFRSWQLFLSELSAARKLDLTDLISKLEMCGKPALNLSKKR